MLPRPNVRQRIVNWLLANDDVKLPAGVEFGENSVTIGSTDVQFDADGGLAQQDGTQVASLPNDGSLAIGGAVTNTGIAAGATQPFIEGFTGDDGGGGVYVAPTDGVSTSAMTILEPPFTVGEVGNVFCVVSGRDQSSNPTFSDIVQYQAGGPSGPTAHHSETTNSPAARTYSISNNIDLQLAMASDTYNIVTSAILTRRDA